jgi:hypothetical protein
MGRLPVLAFLVLASFAGPAVAADVAGGTFGAGFIDGFSSLVKLLASPLFDVTLVPEDLGMRTYTLGYYLGVLAFTGVAGAAAAGSEGEEAVGAQVSLGRDARR